MYVTEEVVCLHWHVRKTYQTFLYRFNAYYFFRIWKRKLRLLTYRIEYQRSKVFTFGRHFYFIRLYLTSIEYFATNYWYFYGWTGWCSLTLFLYFNAEIRDLGPSHEIYDYNPEARMGLYRTFGFFLLFSWSLWTWAANSSFISTIYILINRFFIKYYTWRYWYEIIIYSFIEMPLVTYIQDWWLTTSVFLFDRVELQKLSYSYYYDLYHETYLSFTQKFINADTKAQLLWFPWSSFFNYLTVLGLVYLLTFLSIYNTDNTYYLVLYMIFLIFVFASTLVMVDLDIFAGLLVLIESVVILMLFFLIIYLTPNVVNTSITQKWKTTIVLFIILTVLSTYSYVNLGMGFFQPFSITADFYDDFYEALHEVSINDLTGLSVNLYWTNSVTLVVIGLLLLIASIICVVLVSFFTKFRNFNLNVFLEIFDIFKTCYSFIFLRKQNLSKQGRGTASSRVYTKKTFDSNLHSEYKEKHDIFEKKKQEEQKKAAEAANAAGSSSEDKLKDKVN